MCHLHSWVGSQEHLIVVSYSYHWKMQLTRNLKLSKGAREISMRRVHDNSAEGSDVDSLWKSIRINHINNNNTLFKYIYAHKHDTWYTFEKEDREVIPIKGPLTELLKNNKKLQKNADQNHWCKYKMVSKNDIWLDSMERHFLYRSWWLHSKIQAKEVTHSTMDN